MSISTILFIILIALVVGVNTIKVTLSRSVKAVVNTVDNGAEVLFTASAVGKTKSQAYLLDGIEKDLKKVQDLKTKYPDFFI